MIKYLIKSHRFFGRESQHYILGNWKEYIKDKKAIRDYNLRYPKAYIKFMWFSFKDYFKYEV